MLALLLASSLVHPVNDKERVLTGCASQTPPFILMTNGKGTAGFSFELFKTLATQLGYKAEVQELPWARCLMDVKEGKVDVAIDAYDDAERRKVYFYSMPYHKLTPQVFYHASNSKLPVSTLLQLQRLQGCGIREYTYEHYGLDARLMELGAPNDKTLIEKLNFERCDYAVEELEYIIGGRNYIPGWPDESNIKSFRPMWAQAPSVHFLINKRQSNIDFLKKLDEAIKAQEKRGFIKALQAKYFQAYR